MILIRRWGELGAQQEGKNETAVVPANDETDCNVNTTSATILHFSNCSQQPSSTDPQEKALKDSTLGRPPKAETKAAEAKEAGNEPFKPPDIDASKSMEISSNDAMVQTKTTRSKETRTQRGKQTGESPSRTTKDPTISIASKNASDEIPKPPRISKVNSTVEANINNTNGLKREAIMEPTKGQEAYTSSSRPADDRLTTNPEVSQKETKAQSWFDSPPWKAASTLPKQEEGPSSIIEDKSGVSDYKRISSDEGSFVVLYRDLYTGVMRAENLTSVTMLGYNITEIPYLQPDALALIVEDEIRKPTRGIPQQWQISQSQYEVLSGDIRIVPRIEAVEIIDSTNEKNQSAAKKARYPTRGDSARNQK